MSSSVKILSSGYSRDGSVIYDHRIIASPNKCAFPTHSHGMCELLYFVSGEASYYIEGRVYTLKPGDLVFIRDGKHHMLVVNGGSDYERYDVMFSPNVLPPEIYEKTRSVLEVVSLGRGGVAGELFSAADRYRRDGGLEGDEYQAFLRALILAVSCEFIDLAPKVSEDKCDVTVKNEAMHLALMYINKNLSSIRGIDEICERLYITKRYLHYLFKANLGTTPKKYLTEKRLLLARGEIKSGKSLTEAYRTSGFSDYTSFYRNYKSYFGHVPSLDSYKNQP